MGGTYRKRVNVQTEQWTTRRWSDTDRKQHEHKGFCSASCQTWTTMLGLFRLTLINLKCDSLVTSSLNSRGSCSPTIHMFSTGLWYHSDTHTQVDYTHICSHLHPTDESLLDVSYCVWLRSSFFFNCEEFKALSFHTDLWIETKHSHLWHMKRWWTKEASLTRSLLDRHSSVWTCSLCSALMHLLEFLYAYTLSGHDLRSRWKVPVGGRLL